MDRLGQNRVDMGSAGDSTPDQGLPIATQARTMEQLYVMTVQMRGGCYPGSSPCQFLSTKVELGPFPTGKLIAAQDLQAGMLIFQDKPRLTYPNFMTPCLGVKDSVYKVVDVRGGVMPANWTCICCSVSIGAIVPVWCSECELPLCPRCGVDGRHNSMDSLCSFSQSIPNRGRRRFLELGDVYLDVALTRFLRLEMTSEEFRNEVAEVMKDPHLGLIMDGLEDGPYGYKFTKRFLPLAFGTANNVNESILRAFGILTTFGNGFYPRADIGIFHPAFIMFNQACAPNTEVQLDLDKNTVEIWTTHAVRAGEMLSLDFLQHPLLPTVYRQRFFKSRWGFGCACARCADPTELGTFLGSIKCPKCPNGYLSPEFIRFTEKGVLRWDEAEVSCRCIDPANPTDNPCDHTCLLVKLTEQDDEVCRLISKMKTLKSRREKHEESQKLKKTLFTEFGLHVNHFLIHAIDGNNSSPQLQFISRLPTDAEFECSSEEIYANLGISGFQDQLESFHRFSSIVLRLTSQLCRHHGYMVLYETQLEKALGRMAANRSAGPASENELRRNYVFRIAPKVMEAWKQIIWRMSEEDTPALDRLLSDYITLSSDPKMSKTVVDLIRHERRGNAARERFENGAGQNRGPNGHGGGESADVSSNPGPSRPSPAEQLFRAVQAVVMEEYIPMGSRY